jgi:hypothetical protein
MKILDRLPYSTDRTVTDVRGETVQVKAYQILVWVSVSAENILEWDPRTPRFPAILDTGNNHNFAIAQGQLLRWAGLDSRLLPLCGAARESGQRLPLHAADLWLHLNRAKTREISEHRQPARLGLRQGLTVYPDETAPRLPILGLRALTVNHLRSLIDGEKREVTIYTARPRWWPFG